MAFYCEQPPGAALNPWVECAWVAETGPGVYAVPPDGCLDILYDRLGGLRAIGAMTVQQRFRFPRVASLAGIRFRPGMAAAFLRASPAELTDRAIPLDELLGTSARELARTLDGARSIRDAMAILLGNLRPPAGPPNPVQHAIQAIAAVRGTADLDRVSRDAGLSARHFRRRCIEESGLTPKLLSRVLRFRHAYRLAARAGHPNWADIALECGYFDQAHLIREFHSFTGLAPMAVFSNTPATRSR